jgi:penicillin amidase
MRPIMRRGLRWIGLGILSIVALLIVAALGGWIWLRTSLPRLDGTLELARLHAAVTIARDDRGVPTIQAHDLGDAYFALGFAHAQDRLFQMDMMRRLGAGRLSEVIGQSTVPVDRMMRTLNFKAMAEQQLKDGSPALQAALADYAAGVNAFLAQRRGAPPPEFVLLGYRPEPWQPVDSLLWGRIMALQLSGNQAEERLNLALQKKLPADLFKILLPEAQSASGLSPNWFGRLSIASNNWVVGPEKSADGAPILANDPHLALGAPSIWYLAHVVTPEMRWVGVTSPGFPMLVIGANDDVAWGFTTTGGDTEDLFEERSPKGDPDHYETPDGLKPFETRREIIKVKGAPDVSVTIRSTRHGPVVSDLDEDRKPGDPIYALSAVFELPDDRTPDALLAMNAARSADDLRKALADFAVPEQNVVYADRQGHIGFMAAGRVPIRKQVYMSGLLPAPGWSGDYDWIGTLPVDALPQSFDPPQGWLATANNRVADDDHPAFITGRWAGDERYRRIAELLRAKPKLSVADMEAMQMDDLSQPLRDLVRGWLPRLQGAEPEIAGMLAKWDGRMDRDRPEPLIATLWMQRVAERLLVKPMGPLFNEWWFWNDQALKALLADGRWCGDGASCDEILVQSLRDTISRLKTRLGDDPARWKWGAVHRLHFQHPIFRFLPLISDWLDPDLPTDGDNFTLNRGVPIVLPDSIAMPDVHGPTMRFIVDMKDPMGAVATLAGGQSGNPFSPSYDDWLADWRDGRYRTIVQPPIHTLKLEPKP